MASRVQPFPAAAEQFFAAAMPGLKAELPQPEAVRAIAMEAIVARYGDAIEVAMMFGSHALGCPNPLSDCDLLVVRESEAANEKIQLVHGGIALELSAYRLSDLRGLLRQAGKGGALDLPWMVAMSTCLSGDAGLHADLVESARTIMASPGPPLHPAAREQMCSRASAMTLKFIAARDRYDAILVAGRLIALLAFLIMRFETGRSYDSPHYALTGLRSVDRPAAEALETAFRRLVDHDDRDAIVVAAMAALNRLGGACWNGLRCDLPGPFRPQIIRREGAVKCTDPTPHP